MKKFMYGMLAAAMLLGMWSCSEETTTDDTPTVEELQQEINALRAQLEQKITAVNFEGSDMLLTFADGTTLRTPAPESVIPTIGENGNWWVNGTDLGVKAVASVPTIGANGNWIVDGEDTGVSAAGTEGPKGDKGEQGEQGEQGEKGDKGDKGDTGVGIQTVDYDLETGILTIVLTNGEEKNFSLGIVEGEGGEVNVGGTYLDDTTPALLKAIWNGDMPFAQFEYDANNNMTKATYYQNILNEATPVYGVEQEFNAQGKVSKQSFFEYATTDKAVMNGWEFPGMEWLDPNSWQYTFLVVLTWQFFNTLFPDGIANVESLEIKNEVMLQILDQVPYGYINDDGMNGKMVICGSYVYVIQDYNWDYVRYWFRVKSDRAYTRALREADGRIWLYTNSLYYDVPNIDFDDDDDTPSASIDRWYNAEGGVDVSTIAVNVETETDDSGDEYIVNCDIAMTPMEEGYYVAPNLDGFQYRIPVVALGVQEDEVTADYVKDYETVDMERTYNEAGVSGEYKYLIAEYDRYQKGEKIYTETIVYNYDGNNMTGNYDEEDVFIAEVVNNQILSVRAEVSDTTMEKAVEITYNADGTIQTFDVPAENVTGVANFIYDDDKNLTEVIVNASKLEGKGYADVMCALGLAYRYEDYNTEWGTVVEDVKYVDGTVLKLGYNKNVKNFMNHTMVGISPLLQFLVKGKHAVNELIWAGHASCFISTYSSFNGWGYPEQFEGLLRVSPDDIEGEIDLPVNGSVSTLYKLEYAKKK